MAASPTYLVDDSNKQEAIFRELFRVWLRSVKLHGCLFARGISKHVEPFVSFRIDDESIGDSLTAHFSALAAKAEFGLALFPTVETESQLLTLLNRIAASDRWGMNLLECDRPDVLVELLWSNDHGSRANAVGFGPFGCMPLTRRAPVMAIGLWPGAHDNPFLEHQGATIGLADTRHALSREKYREKLKETEDNFNDLVAAGTIPKPVLRRTSFRLSAEFAERLQLKQS